MVASASLVPVRAARSMGADNDVLGDAPLSTDVFLSLFTPELDFLGERPLTASSFDMRQMVITGRRGFFPGDYVGLAGARGDFVAAFTRSNNLDLPVVFPQDENGLSSTPTTGRTSCSCARRRKRRTLSA